MKKTLSIITMLTLVFAMALTGYVSAAAEVTVTAPTEAVAVGEEVVVTVKPSEVLEGISFRLNYDETVLEFVSATGPDVAYGNAGAGTAGLVSAMYAIDPSTETATDMTVTLTFKALVESEGTDISVTELALSAEGGVQSTPADVTNKVVVGETTTEEPPVEEPGTEEPPVEEPGTTENPGETGTGDEKPAIPQTGANVFAYVVAGIVLVAVLALVVKAKKD